jgi:hypothetical protein
MKQFIRVLDEEMHFGIMELDETHLLLHGATEQTLLDIQTRLDELLTANTFELHGDPSGD